MCKMPASTPSEIPKKINKDKGPLNTYSKLTPTASLESLTYFSSPARVKPHPMARHVMVGTEDETK